MPIISNKKAEAMTRRVGVERIELLVAKAMVDQEGLDHMARQTYSKTDIIIALDQIEHELEPPPPRGER